MSGTKNVFDACTIGPMRLRNRIIRAATHEGMSHPDGMPTDDLARLYRRLAEGGAGAIITGYVGVLPGGRTFANMRMFDRDEHTEAYRKITAAVRPLGAPLILQLAHGGSRAQRKLSGQDVIAPSARSSRGDGDGCREATGSEIEEIIAGFVRAVVRARDAGFDGIELHAAHGYLLSEFVSPVLNRRTDRWGGTIENRLRIVREILERARQQVGAFPLLVKISAHDENRKGVSERDAVAMAQLLQQSGCSALEVSCGYGDFFYSVRMRKMPAEAILRLAAPFRDFPPFQKRLLRLAMRLRRVPRPLSNYNVDAAERIRRAVDIPVIAVGGIRSLSDIAGIVSARNIDMVSLSRPFIIEPDIVERFRSGKQDRSKCIDCGYCLIGVTDSPLRCYYGRLPQA